MPSTIVLYVDHSARRVDRDRVHADTASGARASRPKLERGRQLLRAGDALKVALLGRLSRAVLHLVALGADLRGRSPVFESGRQGLVLRSR
ncbi:recombinase family protein [Yinghuangia soli]|uniref:Recombinase family protein n=1 Tax=Yinghuangia soli TaxID=2908204 RepID=A0AA41U3V0_9ACTN|nr:recombinase family protein [Yinghuangia soli]MCF2532201.1 recombinase family protein [Yinghuangia soli]